MDNILTCDLDRERIIKTSLENLQYSNFRTDQCLLCFHFTLSSRSTFIYHKNR